MQRNAPEDSREMYDFIAYINSLNTTTWFIIGALVFVGGFIMQQIVDSRMLTTVFSSAFLGGALGLNFASIKTGVTLLPSPEMNLMALSTIGMVVALGVTLVLMRVTTALVDATRPTISRDSQIR